MRARRSVSEMADGEGEVSFEVWTQRVGSLWRHRWEDAVWEGAPDDALALVILLALGRRADWTDGSRCFPSVETLAKMARCSERSARAKLRDLQAAGWITAEERAGRATLYVLHLPTSSPTVEQIQGGNSCPPISIQGRQEMPGCGVETTAGDAGGAAGDAGGAATPAPDHGYSHGYRSEAPGEMAARLHLTLSAFLKLSFKDAGRELDEETAEATAKAMRAEVQDGERLRAWIVSKLAELARRSSKVGDKGAATILRADAKRGLREAAARSVEQEARPPLARAERGAVEATRWMLPAEEIADRKPRAKVIDLFGGER